MKFWNIFITIVLATGFSLQGKEPVSILALGDSITQGGKTYVSYRQALIPELRKKKVAFEFIGPEEDAASAHAGYGGKSTNRLLGMTKKIYSKYPADIVMIHSGHNSFSKNKPIPGIIRDTQAIIDTIRKINPKVTILLAQVIPAGKLPKYAYIPELNKELDSLATRLTKRGYHIVLVDQEAGFNWKKDTIKDKVHPNANGAKKMAEKWAEALLPLLTKSKAKVPNK